MWNKGSQQSMFEVIIHVGRLCSVRSISIVEKNRECGLAEYNQIIDFKSLYVQRKR